MKICIIHNLWGDEARGGAESVLTLIVEGLRTLGHQVVIMTTQGKSKETLVSMVDGVQVYGLPSRYVSLTKAPQWKRLFFHIVSSINLFSYLRVKKIIQAEKPKVVWTHNLVGLGSTIFCLFQKKNIRHLHTLHDIQLLHPSGLMMRGREKIIDSLTAFVYQTIQKMYISSFSEIVSPSKWLLETHRNKGFFKKNSCQVLPNPFLKKNEVEKHKVPNDFFTFLYVGQIEYHKGISLLSDSFKKITNHNIRLIVIGDGSWLEKIKAQNLDTRIDFLGRQPSFSVKKIMKSADCLVVPSLCYENFPTVILEAMSASTPVIASGFGGINELILDDQFLFEPTIDQIQNKLEWAIEHQNDLHNLFYADSNFIDTMSVVEYCKKLKL